VKAPEPVNTDHKIPHCSLEVWNKSFSGVLLQQRAATTYHFAIEPAKYRDERRKARKRVAYCISCAYAKRIKAKKVVPCILANLCS
jgi:hypothetical protein